MRNQIESLINSGNTELTLKGISFLEKYQEADTIVALQALNKSDCPEIAEKAKIVLLKICKEVLAIDDSPESRRVRLAVNTINDLDPAFKTYIHDRITNGDIRTKIQALTLIKHFISVEEAYSILNVMLRHPSQKVRATAIHQIGYKASRNNAEILTKFLKDSDNRVIANTIEVLEQIKIPMFKRILEPFRKHENNRIRANALKALFNLGELNIHQDIQKMLRDPNVLMRASAVWLIGELGRAAYYMLRFLELVKNDKEELIRHNLMILLRKVGNAPQADFLRVALKSEKKLQLKQAINNKKDISVRAEKRENYMLLNCTGILTATTLLVLKLKFEELDKIEKRFVLNFSELNYIDSTGIGLLINFQKMLNKKEGYLYICQCPYNIAELFQLSRVDTVLHTFHTLDEIDNFIHTSS